MIMKLSTISIAEFCVRDEVENLPIKDLQIIPFNLIRFLRKGKYER